MSHIILQICQSQKLLLGHFVYRAAMKLSYNKRSSYTKDVTTENKWTFELGVGVVIDFPILVIKGFMQLEQFNQQHQNNDKFYRSSLVISQCNIGSEEKPDSRITFNYAIEEFSQA